MYQQNYHEVEKLLVAPTDTLFLEINGEKLDTHSSLTPDQKGTCVMPP